MKKFTLPAGTTNRHQWHKEAAAAITAVTRTFDMMRQIYGQHGGESSESLVSVLNFGRADPKNPEAVKIYNALGERHGWQITRENAADIAMIFREALPNCMKTVPIEDNRTTAEEDAERHEQRAQQAQAQQVIADEKAGKVEQLAEDLRKQYPDAIGPDSGKSGHARASANLKRVLQAQGLRVSVKSSSFSMGNSVTADILTPDLPPERREEIEAIVSRFSYGTFDPMTDSSGYDRSDEGEAWEAVHGRAKYCRADYKQSDECRAAIREFLGTDDRHSSEPHQVWSGAHCRADEFWQQWTEDHKPAEPEAGAQGAGYAIEKHHHTKRGFDFWLVVLADRVDRPEFERLRDSCKAAGGWYSRQWRGMPGGFAFEEREQAGAWAVQEFGSGDDGPRGGMMRAEARAVDARPPPKPKQDTHKAGKFREMAEKLDAEVLAKRGDHLENTPKRQREGMSRRIDADRLERTAQALRALADLYEAGPLPALLAKFTSKKAVYAALGVRTESSGYYNVTATDERTDTGPEAVALWGLLNGKDPEQERAEKLHNMETAVLGSQIAGYFPTPEAVAYDMVSEAGITAAHTVLEPSAGSGAILDQIADLHHEPAAVVAYEISPTLCEILQAKGYDSRPRDFLEQEPGAVQFDRVLMNPPFEKMQDIDHVRHAFEFLKPGGRLVAIMSPGPFYRSDRKAAEFRDWFEDLGGEVSDIEAGAFKESGTGVASKMVTIDKADDSEPLGMEPPEPCDTCGAHEGEIHPPGCADLIEQNELF